ncbi:MAG: glutamate-5-semialdehyde dehydrogenase, partial [Planctomycetota bacterium]
AKDLDAAADLPAATVGRLKLDAAKVAKIAKALREIADQPDPLGRVLHGEVRPNGLRLEKRAVPLGVVLFIYESRPNVTADAAALCLKSGNAVILRGGKEAAHSAAALFAPIREAITEAGLPENSVQLVDRPDRELVPLLLAHGDAIDVAIPRGGKGLIQAVTESARMPVLKHLDGNCHLYVHADAATWSDGEMSVADMLVNAKTSYPGGGVCNAVEHVLFHRDALPLLPAACDALAAADVDVRGDEAVRRAWPKAKPVDAAEWDEEYLALIVSLKVVGSLDDAVAHINRHGSRHTDGILTRDTQAAEAFVAGVDSASVTVNASTRFADGGEYGLGAEIGISTDKLHARGPMGAADLCSYKWIVTGDGHLRP